MLATAYPLPFAFEIPVDNPWDGQGSVGLALHGAAPLDNDDVEIARECLKPFWSLARVGGLAGTAVAPWLSVSKDPESAIQQGIVYLRFDSYVLDERATHCLLCLLLTLHEKIPLSRVKLSTPGTRPQSIMFDPNLEDPFPGLWPRLPFPHIIEDSESEDRLLRAQFAVSLDDEGVSRVHEDLMRWGSAAAAGAYGIAPIEPRRCDCLPVNPVEHYKGELIWAIEKCRFHYGALRALVAVCAAIHHRVEAIVDLAIE